MNESSVGKYTNDNSILTLNPPPNFKLLFNQFNEITAESNKKNAKNFIICRNLDIDEMQNMKNEQNLVSLFHINSVLSTKILKTLNTYLKLLKKLLM